MLTNGVIVRTGQLSRAGINQQILKNGSSVLVRITEDKGNGKYTGSVAGVKVNITSLKNLKVGSTFVGTIDVTDGKISITPKNTEILNQEKIELSLLNNQQLYSILQKLGLPQDATSINLLQLFKKMEMKFDTSLLKKLYNLTVKYKGKEKSALEILMLLVKKGIKEDSEAVLQLINLLENCEEFLEKNNHQKDKGKHLLNKINGKEGYEYLLPFELVEINTSESLGSGIIRIVYSSHDRIKMLNLNCQYNGEKYLFSLDYNGGKCEKIRFYSDKFTGENIEDKVLNLSRRLTGIEKSVIVEWASEKELEGLACEGENIYSFTGAV